MYVTPSLLQIFCPTKGNQLPKGLSLLQSDRKAQARLAQVVLCPLI